MTKNQHANPRDQPYGRLRLSLGTLGGGGGWGGGGNYGTGDCRKFLKGTPKRYQKPVTFMRQIHKFQMVYKPLNGLTCPLNLYNASLPPFIRKAKSLAIFRQTLNVSVN